MGATFAIVLATVLLAVATWVKRDGLPRLPPVEAAWFHAAVTWPILMKASLGSFLFADALADGRASYTLIVYGPAAIMGVIAFAHRLTAPGARVFGAGLIVVLAQAFVLPQVVFGEEQPTAVLIAIAMTLPIAMRSRSSIALWAWVQHARVALTVVAGSVLIVALLSPGLIIGACRLDKCSLFGETVISPITNNGNFLGVAAALIFPLTLARAGFWRSVVLAAGSLVLVEVSGSRSALIAMAVVIGAVLISTVTRRSGLGVALALTGTLAATAVTALVQFPSTFATYRGGLWTRARDLLLGNEFFGLGPTYWSRNEQEISMFPNYSPHNVWLELAVSGGVLMVAVVVVAGWWSVRTVPPIPRPHFLLLIVAVLAVGVLEAPLAPAKLGLAPFALLLPLMVASGYPVRSRVPSSSSPLGPPRAGFTKADALRSRR